MYELELTKRFKTIVDKEVYEILRNTKWCIGTGGYALRRRQGINEYLHNFILPPREGFVIDHINGNSLDNRRVNLRYATISQNAANSRIRKGTSIYKGVSYDRQMYKWRASINYKGIKKVIGLFDKERWAAMAYDIAAKDIYKDFSSLNFNQSV